MKRRIAEALPVAAALALSATAGLAQTVENTSYSTPDGMRVLRHEIVVDASRDEVWDAFTTSDGWTSWAAPVAFVDFRRGGTIETSYDRNAQPGDPANIKSVIPSYLPNEMLSLRVVQTPPEFPHRELTENLWSVFFFEDAEGGKTRVIAAGAGYREGEGYDTIYGFFEQANAMALQQLARRLREGPVDWTEALEAIERHREAGASAGEEQ